MLTAVSVCLLSALIAGAAPVAPEPFVQDRFAIGFWVGPPVDGKADARYAEIAEANFNLVIGGFGAHTREAVETQLVLAEKYGLKVLVHLRSEPVETWPEGPACWGYSLRDEPSAADFPVLRAQVDAVRQHHPGKLAYINLFPNYANEKQLGAKTYEEHVQRFADEVGTDVLSFDHYPIMRPDADGRNAYCRNLEVFRQCAQEAGVPFWNFFNTMPYGPHSDPTEAQLRWQVFASAAYGAKGVLYFCYYTPAGGEFPKGGAIIRRDGRRTRHYEQAMRINAVLRNFGPTLMKLTSMGVRRLPRGGDFSEGLDGTPVAEISDGDFLLGLLRHEDGRRAVLLVNHDIAYTVWPTVRFDVAPEAVLEVSPETGAAAPVLDDSPAMEGLQVSLDAGGARLFLLPDRAV